MKPRAPRRVLPPTLRPRLESDIQREILKAAPLLGLVLFPYKPGVARAEHKGRVRRWTTGTKGVSDLIGYRRFGGNSYHIAQFVAIEVKRPGGLLTNEQRAFFDAVWQAGGLTIVATSVDDVRKAVEHR